MPKVLQEELRPISRKASVRALTRNPTDDATPVICRTDLIRAAKAALGLTDADIAARVGLSKPTVQRALHVEPSTRLYDFCAVMRVLELEIADLFPIRANRVVNGPPEQWTSGPYIQENAEILQHPPAALLPRRRMQK